MKTTDELQSELQELRKEVEDLHRQCSFFHMQVERMTHMFSLVQEHELKLYNLKCDHKDDTGINDLPQRHT